MTDAKKEWQKWSAMSMALLEIPKEDRSQNWTKYHAEVLDRVQEWNGHIEHIERINKLFTVTDKTGRSAKSSVFNYEHIRFTFDLNEEDFNSEKTLCDFVHDSEVGEVWENYNMKIERIANPDNILTTKSK